MRVKICCISSEEEARMAVALGASALGLVSEMPSGPGVISETEIARIAGSVPPGVSTFLLTCLQSAAAVIDQHRRCRTSTIQICDTLDDGDYDQIREALPGIKLVQVIHVRGDHSLIEARSVAPHVDALLLDSGNQQAAVKELGGTGRVHDWSISRRIVDESGRPVFLAGGINEGNVQEAVRTVRPFGIDLCSSVRTNGELDRSKLARFMAAIREVSN